MPRCWRRTGPPPFARKYRGPHTQLAHLRPLYSQGVSEMNGPPGESLSLSQSLEGEKAAPATLSERVQTLFEQLRLPVFRFLLRKTRNRGRAEDLTQETFLRLCRYLRDERPLDNPKAWLLTVANNLAIDEIRSDRHQTDLDESAWTEIEESRSGTQAGPEEVTPTSRSCRSGRRMPRRRVRRCSSTTTAAWCRILLADRDW